ncbi:MAG: hypothetical protein HY913_03230 [Desulfomonile tiedjei]|nr:hypothetical protein [Desulfomonile tiedjei]
MPEFQSVDPDAAVVGDLILGFVDAFPPQARDVALKLLEWNGIRDVLAAKFYPLQSVLSTMQDVSETFGSSMLFCIGEQFAMNAKLSSNIASLEACLASLDEAYRRDHKGKEIGSYEYSCEVIDGYLAKAKMVCKTPYSCSFERGMIEGFVQRLKPTNCTDVFVRSVESEGCRKNGGASCTYFISWILRVP